MIPRDTELLHMASSLSVQNSLLGFAYLREQHTRHTLSIAID
jgi:hypothetical protein